MSELFSERGVEIRLKKREDFLKVKETLTRIGVSNSEETVLNQTCHILHKRGRYAIFHYKEMYLLDGKEDTTHIEEEDYARRNAIAKLLSDWGLVEIIEVEKALSPEPSMDRLRVIKHDDKPSWTLVAKYTFGTRKKPEAS